MTSRVTLLIYTFPKPGTEDAAFAKIVASIVRTWEHVGRLKTVIVASHRFAAVEKFSAEHANVELQIEPTVVPGNIKTMSLDCIKRLYRRFTTEYVLVIQDDGFPIRSGLEEFLDKCDFYGAPIISDGWKRKLAYAIGLGSFNGGFSLRSRRLCEYASKMWFSFFSKFMPEDHRHLGEDFYYTTLLKFLPMTWFKFRFPSEQEAFQFSVDTLGGRVMYPEGVDPFGVHGKDTISIHAQDLILSVKKELTEMPTTGEAATVKATCLNPPSTHTVLKKIYDVNGLRSLVRTDASKRELRR